MKKKLAAAVVMLVIMASATACSKYMPQEKPVQSASKEPAQETQQKAELPTEDRAGNKIEIPENVEKIISMSPSNTEIIVALGLGDKIIATDKYSRDIEGLPEGIPYFDMMTPDVEQLVALEPDLIIASGMSKKDGNDPFKPVKDLGICMAYIPSSSSMDGIYEDIMFLANSLHAKEKGQELVEGMKVKIDEIKKLSANVKEKKTIYFEIAAMPNLYSFGSGVFLNEMIEIIGAENVFKDQEKWISVSDESVLAANPDVILTNVSYVENPTEEIKSRAGWDSMEAVKNNQVFYIDNTSSSLSNHNVVKALQEIAEAVYPEVYVK
ncbi:MAG: ABC transporter substrate-binding protein [Sedimentibacter sp.]|uniref:ABC transporter substrate-binding protein n=1 Tax=Sedimentibacter sp. TaxID=1960295 RepID=UPI003158DDCD